VHRTLNLHKNSFGEVLKMDKSKIKKAVKDYKKKHNVKSVKETTALIGVKILIKV
jgi:hypothetical protein